MFIQLPFADDLTKFTFPPFLPSDSTAAQNDAALKLVDSMTVDDDELVSSRIPNPAIRSLNLTLIDKVSTGSLETNIVDVRANGEVTIDVPPSVAERSKPFVREFERLCPLARAAGDKNAFTKKRFWSDVDEGEA